MLNLRWTPIPTRPQLTLTALNVPESVQIIRLMDTAVGPTFYLWYYSSSSVCLVKPLKQCQLSYYCLVMMDIPLCAIEALYIKNLKWRKIRPNLLHKIGQKVGNIFTQMHTKSVALVKNANHVNITPSLSTVASNCVLLCQFCFRT